MSDLRISKQGIRGGNWTRSKVGCIKVIFDQTIITVDHFSGVGPSYRKREIPIVDVVWNIHGKSKDAGPGGWTGTIDELVTILKNHKK